MVNFGQIVLSPVHGLLLGLGFLPGLDLLLLGFALPDLGASAGAGGVLIGRVLPPAPQLEGEEVPHEEGLQKADRDEGVQAEDESVVVAGGQVDGLLLDGGLGQAVPEGQHGQENGSKSGQHEEDVVHGVERAGHILRGV